MSEALEKADTGKVLALLQIADLARQWPNLKPIHDKAMSVLEAMVKPDPVSVPPPPEPAPPRTVGPQGATVTHDSFLSSGGTIASRRPLAETSGGSDA